MRHLLSRPFFVAALACLLCCVPFYPALAVTDGVASTASGNVGLYTGGTERLHVDSSGNVSIGGAIIDSGSTNAVSGITSGSGYYGVVAQSSNASGTGLLAQNTANSNYCALATPNYSIFCNALAYFNGPVSIYVGGSNALSATSTTGNTAVVATSSGNSGTGVTGVNSSSNYYCNLGQYGYSIGCSGPTSGVSDRRLKKDIRPLQAQEGLNAIMHISPVHYRWRDEKMNIHPNGEIGFIAQNVEAALPDLVGEMDQPPQATVKLPGGKEKVLQYDRIIAPAVLAIQQLKQLSDTDHDALVKLRADNDNLRKADDHQAKAIDDLRALVDKQGQELHRVEAYRK